MNNTERDLCEKAEIIQLHEKAQYGTLKDAKNLTTEKLNKRTSAGNTVWHVAALYNTLKDIPKNLFTIKALSQIDADKRTVWHLAAQRGALNTIPKNLFTSEALAQVDKFGSTVWENLIEKNSLPDIPLHLITLNLLEMRNGNNFVFKEKDRSYIEKVVYNRTVMFNEFIAANPQFAKDVEHRDERLKVADATHEKIFFSFDGVNDLIVLAKEGVFINNIIVSGNPPEASPLNEAVLFIENNYENVEKSIPIPTEKSSILDSFVL